MQTYFFYEQCQEIEPEWKQYFYSIIIGEVQNNGVVYFTQEGTEVKIQLQAGQEYPLQDLKEICYQKAREHGGIPLFKYDLRRKGQ
jgi:hypothetical protein